MPDSIVREIRREVEPLRSDDHVLAAARKVIAAGLPALPVMDEHGEFAGIFGEREFMAAVLPGYVGTLASARMVSHAMEATIELREACRDEPIRDYLTTDDVVVPEEPSDIHIAELFMHHRVLIVPIAMDGRVHAVVTRNDFFQALARRFPEGG